MLEYKYTIIVYIADILRTMRLGKTFAASTLKQKSYAERKSQLSGSLRSVSAVQ